MKYWILLYGCLISSWAMAESKQLKNARLIEQGANTLILAGDVCRLGRCAYQEIRLVNNGNLSIDTNEDQRLTWSQFKQAFKGSAVLFYSTNGKLDRILIAGEG